MRDRKPMGRLKKFGRPVDDILELVFEELAIPKTIKKVPVW